MYEGTVGSRIIGGVTGCTIHSHLGISGKARAGYNYDDTRGQLLAQHNFPHAPLLLLYLYTNF